MPDITEPTVFSIGGGTLQTDVTEQPNMSLGYATVPTLMALYVSNPPASQLTVGTPGLVFVARPDGVTSGETVGSPTLALSGIAHGVPSSVVFGQASTTASASATGVASPGAVGTPRAALVMSPVGVSLTSALGTPQANATVGVVPGPIDPADGFGDPVVTKNGWIFRPPVNTYKWRLFKEYEGISLLKENGVWSEVAHPDLPRTKDAEMYLAGGRDHVVGDALKAELEGLGYTVTQEPVTTEEYL